MAPLIGVAVATAAAYFLAFSSTVTVVLGSLYIGSDLTILTHNDLYGNASPRKTAIIVLSRLQSRSDARERCRGIEETLWNLQDQPEGLDLLRYLDGKGENGIDEYWFGSATCQTINTRGEIRDQEHCDVDRPALCTQSAPLSSPSSADTDRKWQNVVRTGNVNITGYRDRLSFRFLGLQYGTAARFDYAKYRVPTPNTSALAYGPTCFQGGCTRPQCEEVCQYLNIWTPYLPDHDARPVEKKKAVMVWIHGGGFTGGSGSDTTFDGGNLASRGDVVVVTINYRLGSLGFLALENTPFQGNYGISDQIAALDWIHAHIRDFGGDPNRITVFGQSAGAASVRVLLASPRARGRFSGAIMQSNPAGLQYASTFSHYLTIAEATARTKAIVDEVGCKQANTSDLLISCMQSQDVSKFVGGTVARYPVIDGIFLTSNGLPLSGSAPDTTNVAILAGIMRDDGSPFSKFSTSSNASNALTEQGFNAAAILGSQQFPLPQSGNITKDIFNLTSRVTTDGEFRCLGQSSAVVGSKNGLFPTTYSYEFDRGYQITEWSPNPPACEAPPSAERPLGDVRLPYFKCHSGELYYVFGTLLRQGRQPRDEDDMPFSQYIVDTWTAFAREKNPTPKLEFLAARGYTNTSRMVEKSSPWKPLDAKKPTSRILGVEVRDEGFREQEQCAVLELPLDYYSK